jgi:hypothetical protein
MLQQLDDQQVEVSPTIEELELVSRSILQPILDEIDIVAETGANALQRALHMSSLAVQVLCVGLLSYSQAHIGKIRPFFLDSSLEQVLLLGLEASVGSNICIKAGLYQLTCLAGMVGDSVVIFSLPSSTDKLDVDIKFDICAKPEDILDTWGPGQLVYRRGAESSPVAIMVGRGYISPPSKEENNGKYHWDRVLRLPTATPDLVIGADIVIGSLVQINIKCVNDEQTCWTASAGIMAELGTYRNYSEVMEYEFGFQAGPHNVAFVANMVRAKQRGVTVKAKNLGRPDHMLIPFLDFYWGVRVSFCTGVAQRVPLRVLVGDLFPVFASTFSKEEERNSWAILQSQHCIMDRLKGTYHSPGTSTCISDWLGTLSDNLYQFVLGVIRLMLHTLQDTGLSPDGTFFSVAWPSGHIVNKCFRIPLDDYTKWMPMLADSDDCATFAYMTNTCLETAAIHCRGPNPAWENKIRLLETAVLCPAITHQWALRDEQTYFFVKLDNDLFWVKAKKDSTNSSLPATLVKLHTLESVPLDFRYRLIQREVWKNKRRIREKDLSSVVAEVVSVLSLRTL